jgi:hypothetical protein
MLKGARVGGAGKPGLIVLGITDAEAERLTERGPIMFPLRECLSRLPDEQREQLLNDGLDCNVMLLRGEDEETMTLDLRARVTEHGGRVNPGQEGTE